MITIEHVDSYTSTIKYNCGGAGLAAGLKGQADKLVRVIKRQHGVSATPPLRYVKIMLSDEMKKRKMAAGEDANKEALARIVEPFGKLRAQTAKITDVVGADVARTLEKAMTSDVPDVTRDVKSAHEQYPDVVKEEVKDRMKKWAAWKEPISPAGYYTMAAARLTGFSEI